MLLDDDDADGESEDRPTFPDDPSVQHGHLAGLLSRLERLTSTQHGLPQVQSLLEVIISDVSQHFAAEEYAMGRAGYPQLDDHRLRHGKLLRHLETLREENVSGGGPLVPAVAQQLVNWFRDHEHTADAELQAFMRSGRANEPVSSRP